MVSIASVASAAPARVGKALAMTAPVQTLGWRPLNGGTIMAISVPTVMKDERVVCADAVLGCGYGAGPKTLVLPGNLRRAGAGVALTIRGASISIQRRGLRLSTSMRF